MNHRFGGFFSNKTFNMTESKYITVKEYSKRFGVSLKTVYNHIESEKIHPSKIKKVLGTTLIRV